MCCFLSHGSRHGPEDIAVNASPEKAATEEKKGGSFAAALQAAARRIAFPCREQIPRCFALLSMTASAEPGVSGAVNGHHGVGAFVVLGWAGVDVFRGGGRPNAHTVMVNAVVAEVGFGARRPPQPVGARRRAGPSRVLNTLYFETPDRSRSGIVIGRGIDGERSGFDGVRELTVAWRDFPLRFLKVAIIRYRNVVRIVDIFPERRRIFQRAEADGLARPASGD